MNKWNFSLTFVSLCVTFPPPTHLFSIEGTAWHNSVYGNLPSVSDDSLLQVDVAGWKDSLRNKREEDYISASATISFHEESQRTLSHERLWECDQAEYDSDSVLDEDHVIIFTWCACIAWGGINLGKFLVPRLDMSKLKFLRRRGVVLLGLLILA